MQSFSQRPLIPGLRLWIISFFIFFYVNAGGSTYYVSKSGKDSGPGSLVQPWHTIARASDKLKAGDTLFILPGVYNETLRPVCSGREGAPVCYYRYGRGEVILSPDSVGQRCGIFTITGKGMPGYRGDISYIHVWGLTFRGSDHYGICIYGGDDGSSGAHCVFENVRCDSNEVGAFFTCRDLVVRNSEFTANTYGGFWIFSGGRNIRISGCIFHHNGTRGNVDGMTLQDCENVLVEDCEAYGQYDGFDIGSQKDEKTGPGCRYIILRRCRAYSNYNGNLPSSTTLSGPICYQYCTAFDNRDWAGGMVMYEAARNTHIWNCTITRVNVGINFFQGPGPVFLYNNLINADEDAIRNEAGGQIVSSNNLLRGRVPDGTGENTQTTVPPLFAHEMNNDFHPQKEDMNLADKGCFFLHTSTSAKKASSLKVDNDPRIFFFPGDTIQVQDRGIFIIRSLTESTIELKDRKISYVDGLGIHLRYKGKAPDIGAFE